MNNELEKFLIRADISHWAEVPQTIKHLPNVLFKKEFKTILLRQIKRTN